MHYYLYQVTNKLNGKIYVGAHKTRNLEDGYMGSGVMIRRAIEKHGIENFQKTILESFSCPEDMYAREKEIVNEEFLRRGDVYNLRRGGDGGFDFINANSSKESRVERAKLAQKASPWTANEKFKNCRGSLVNLELARKARLQSKKIAGWKHSEDTIANMRKTRANTSMGSENSQFGSFWITDGNLNKKCRGDIPSGWSRGRTSAQGV